MPDSAPPGMMPPGNGMNMSPNIHPGLNYGMNPSMNTQMMNQSIPNMTMNHNLNYNAIGIPSNYSVPSGMYPPHGHNYPMGMGQTSPY